MKFIEFIRNEDGGIDQVFGGFVLSSFEDATYENESDRYNVVFNDDDIKVLLINIKSYLDEKSGMDVSSLLNIDNDTSDMTRRELCMISDSFMINTAIDIINSSLHDVKASIDNTVLRAKLSELLYSEYNWQW